MAQTKKPLVFRDRDTKEKIPFYIKAEDVELPDGTDIETKIDELEEEIGHAGSGTVKSVTLNGTKAEPDENGDVELELEVPEQVQADWEEDDPSDPAYIQHKPTVDDVLDEDSENAIANKTVTAAIAQLRTAIESVIGEGSTEAIENFQEVLDFLENVTDEETLIGLLTTLQTAINGKLDKTDVYNGLDRTTEGKVLDARQGKTLNDLISALQSTVAGKLSKSDVSVETQGSGTVDINVGSGANKDTYTINLNHTHENMAKLIVCEESDLPSTLDEDTIYGVNEDGEIAMLYVGGLPFYGGGGGISTPVLRRPADGSTITMIASGGGDVSETINIKGKNLTQSLIVEFANGSTGYSFDTTDLPTGVAYDSGTGKLTITKDAANAINGVDIVVVYTGSTLGAQGTLGISSSSVDGISCEVHLVAYSFESALAYWRGEDSTSNGKWIDHNNSLPIVLNGTAAKTGDGYQFNNLASQLAAYALFDKTYNSTLNGQIDKVFTCIVRCKVKFGVADRQARIIDFGAFGNSSSGLSIYCVLKDDGTLTSSMKIGSNTSGFNEKVGTANTGIAFTQNSYADIRVKIGSRILANGKQELYCECGNGKCYGIIDTPVKWNFNGVDAGSARPNPAAFVLGLGYTEAQYVEQLAPKAYADVVYQSVVIFNSEL